MHANGARWGRIMDWALLTLLPAVMVLGLAFFAGRA
jgi:hypothetical protein